MAFADGAKAQNESAAICRRAGLVGMPDDAWIEQGRGLERIFVEKISADQATLRLVQLGVWFKRVFHAAGAGFENVEQIPVTTFKVFEHLAQQLRGRFGIEPKHPIDDMIGTDLVSRVEVSRLSRWLEGPDDDSGRIRAQIEALTVQEFGLGQRCSLGAIEMDSYRCRWMIILTRASSGLPQSRQ
jgi:hypothetical protein